MMMGWFDNMMVGWFDDLILGNSAASTVLTEFNFQCKYAENKSIFGT